MRSASRSASARSATLPSVPGVTGTPALIMLRRASVLSPMRRMTSALGPTKRMPRSAQISASSAFSERKP